MSKMIPGNQKHLILSDRIAIESALMEGTPLKEIAKVLCKDPTTISKEIRHHRMLRKANWTNWNRCAYRRKCDIRNLCKNGGTCNRECRHCRFHKCNSVCQGYLYETCSKLHRAPHVCNGCQSGGCRLDKYFYRADNANKSYEALRRESRVGINATPDEIASLDEIVSQGVRNGQSIAHIVSSNNERIKCTEKTIYNYMDGGYFSVSNIDLPRKLHYKPRKSHKADEERRLAALYGRRYSDFIGYMQGKDIPVTELDTVHGREGTKKVLLTMQMISLHLLLSFLLDECTQAEVARMFDEIETAMSPDVFAKTFPVFLADRGPEFLDADAIETSITGGIRTKLFYCDPNAPFQKGHLEKAHTHIRSVFPKKSAYSSGKHNCFDDMSQEKMTLVANHINSFCRDSLCGQSPMSIAMKLFDQKIIDALGLKLIPTDEVNLTPALIK